MILSQSWVRQSSDGQFVFMDIIISRYVLEGVHYETLMQVLFQIRKQAFRRYLNFSRPTPQR